MGLLVKENVYLLVLVLEGAGERRCELDGNRRGKQGKRGPPQTRSEARPLTCILLFSLASTR